jgi:DNA-binding response OmpR family regulator
MLSVPRDDAARPVDAGASPFDDSGRAGRALPPARQQDERMRVLISAVGRARGGDLVRHALPKYGIEVMPARDLNPMMSLRRLPDVILLDCGIVGAEVITACRRLRSAFDVPIVALTTRADVTAWVFASQAGITDFVVQPFGLDELVARLRIAVRPDRAGGGPQARRIALGPLVIQEDARTVTVHGAPIELRPKEYQLLLAMARRPGVTIGRDQLISRVWSADWDGAERTLEVHVASLRAKLGLPGLIATVRGVGYRLRTMASYQRISALPNGSELLAASEGPR